MDFDDAASAGLLGEEFGERRYAEVDTAAEFFLYFIVILWRWPSREIGRGAYQWGAELSYHFLAEGVARDADAQ